MKERQILLLFIISLLCGVSFSQNCKTAGCPSGQCCSQYGYCGTTADHCNTGRVCTPACAAGQCCSPYGYCGTTPEHCAGTGSAAAAASTATSSTATSSSSGGRVCNPPCASGQCCSQYGYCGTTAEHCAGTGTAGGSSSSSSSSSGTATSGSGSCKLSNIFSQADFNTLFPNANAGANNPNLTPGVQKAIFTYNNIINAANYYPQFGCTGDVTTRKRELAAFLAQTSQETSGHWGTQPYVWGYVYSTELGPSGLGCNVNQCPYCQNSGTNPCAGGKGYFGRGPLQLSWNYNYGPVSRAIFNDNRLLNDPDMIVNDGVLAFRTSLWFWMTAQSPKPSAHDVITGLWNPSSADTAAGRLPGFGMTTNIINGGLECTVPTPQKVTNRVKYFERYAGHFAISVGSNLYCNNMQHY